VHELIDVPFLYHALPSLPISGRLLYPDVKRGPRSGWRITINDEVVYESDPQEPDGDTAEGGG
jgi:hypothetical protein